ncbi:MAG TPA: DUF1326 domain-containing protein [Dehalococcoidia bacterium]|nr:DUF1326 domain-containing protein [Dehalococcoidia bacterium]
MAEEWSLRGEYFENCNCRVSCPCTMNLAWKPSSDDGSCHVMLAFNVQQGRYGTISLDGLNAVVVVNTPAGQAMADGGLSAALYLDQRASPQQQEALATILSGQAGGLFGMLAPLMGTVLGVKPARIQFEQDGKKRSLRIDGISEVTGEAVPGALNPDEPVSINNLNIFNASEPITQAVVSSGSYRDYGLQWDNTGMNAYITRLDLQGP